MTTLLIIVGYILNIFLNRWLNLKLVKIDKDYPTSWGLWFLSLITTIALLIFLVEELDRKIKLPKWWKWFIKSNN